MKETGDSGGVDGASNSSKLKTFTCPFFPPILIRRNSLSTARHVTQNPALASLINLWPSLSSSRQMSPFSEQTTAFSSDIAATAVNVVSTNGPSSTFRPDNAFSIALRGTGSGSSANLGFDGDRLLLSRSFSTLQTLICRVPTL